MDRSAKPVDTVYVEFNQELMRFEIYLINDQVKALLLTYTIDEIKMLLAEQFAGFNYKTIAACNS